MLSIPYIGHMKTKAINQMGTAVSELSYISYATNRRNSPSTPVSAYRHIFPAKLVEMMEERYLAESSAIVTNKAA